MFRFLHTGDLHLDSPFVGLSTQAPESVSSVLREATLESWKRVVNTALEERVDFFLVAGDAFENANRTLRGQLRFRDGLGELARAGIPSFIVTGNHDHTSGWVPTGDWPELAYQFPTNHVDSRPVIRDDVEIARVYGIGYRVRDVSTNLAAKFRRGRDVPFAVGLLHANVGGDTSAGNYAPCSMDDLRAADMDYWALGHIHRHRILHKAQPTVVYCGNPQGRDPGEADPRGCYVVTVDDARRVTPEFRAADSVRWQLLDVSIEGLDTDEALIDRVAGAVDEARTKADRSVVARVRLTGRGQIHRTLTRKGVLEDVLGVVRERLGEATPFAWVESVRDETRMELDLAERRLADDFFGDVLRRFEATRAGDAAELDEVLDGLYANERARKYLRDHRPTPKDIERIVAAAEALVADRLAPEG
jgi:exonuclease SbcD